MSDAIINDATVIEGLEACFFDDDFVQNDVMRGKESTGEKEASTASTSYSTQFLEAPVQSISKIRLSDTLSFNIQRNSWQMDHC